MRAWGFFLGFATPIVGVVLMLTAGHQAIKNVVVTMAQAQLAAPAEAEAQVPSIAAQPASSSEGVLGCWRVEATEEDIRGTWLFPCPTRPQKPGKFPVTMGWPDEPVILPAFHVGEPNFEKQRVTADLSDEKATHGVGGMLFLPASQDGQGYYVGAYEAENGESGWTIGLYAVPPISVAAPIGRVYMDEGFKIKPRAQHRRLEAASADEVPEEPSVLPSPRSTNGVSPDSVQIRPRSVELEG